MDPRKSQETARAIKGYEMKFADELKDYVRELRNEYERDPVKARREARDALLRTGVIRG